MKKIYFMLLAMLAMSFTFIACSDDDPFSTATPDDEPRILDPTFPELKNGKLSPVANIGRDANFTMQLIVTPADYTTVSWQIDGTEVQTGKAIDISLNAGTYALKVVVSTEAGKSTYRNGIIQINALPGDPWATEVGFERIIAVNTTARLYGENLDKVESIIIDGKTIEGVTYGDSEEGNYIEYAVPADLAEGKHRVILVDADGNEYGGNTVTVSKTALITSGAGRTNADSEWTMAGINLDQIASLTIGGETLTEFVRQSSAEIAVICPPLPDGEYTLTGKTKNGEDLQFYSAEAVTTEQAVVISSETVLFQGHHYVSWDLPEGDENRTFNLIGKDVFAAQKAGAILSITYSVAPEAEYHQLRTTTVWWNDLPGTAAIDFSEDGVKEVVLTQEVLDKIEAEDGFMCIGHGYYVDLVTVQ